MVVASDREAWWSSLDPSQRIAISDLASERHGWPWAHYYRLLQLPEDEFMALVTIALAEEIVP